MKLNNNSNMSMLAMGEKFPLINFKKFPKKFAYFDFIMDVPTFLFCFNRLQPLEASNCSSGSQLEFRYFTSNKDKYRSLMVKFGTMIQEFCFNPVLCREQVEEYIKNSGNAAYVFVVDSATEKLVILRGVGLTDKIKYALYKQWEVMLDNNLNQQEHNEWYVNLINKYTTKQLWEMAMPVGKIHE